MEVTFERGVYYFTEPNVLLDTFFDRTLKLVKHVKIFITSTNMSIQLKWWLKTSFQTCRRNFCNNVFFEFSHCSVICEHMTIAFKNQGGCIRIRLRFHTIFDEDQKEAGYWCDYWSWISLKLIAQRFDQLCKFQWNIFFSHQRYRMKRDG